MPAGVSVGRVPGKGRTGMSEEPSVATRGPPKLMYILSSVIASQVVTANITLPENFTDGDLKYPAGGKLLRQ